MGAIQFSFLEMYCFCFANEFLMLMSFDHNQTDIQYFNEIADGNLMHNEVVDLILWIRGEVREIYASSNNIVA